MNSAMPWSYPAVSGETSGWWPKPARPTRICSARPRAVSRRARCSWPGPRRPAAVPQASRGWVPLLAGVAVALAVREETGIEASLKWPNDVQVNGAKLAGILAEQAGGAIVVGIGLNVSASRDELPVASATSLALEGARRVAAGPLLVSV